MANFYLDLWILAVFIVGVVGGRLWQYFITYQLTTKYEPICEYRFNCQNINKPYCHPISRENCKRWKPLPIIPGGHDGITGAKLI